CYASVVEDRLEVGSSRVKDVGTVIAGVVLRPFGGRAVVGPAGSDGSPVKLVDVEDAVNTDRQVQVRAQLQVFEEGEAGAGCAEVDALAAVAHAEVERRRDSRIELSRLLKVGDADPEVVDQPGFGGGRFVLDGFDAVAVEIRHESAVVAGAVLRAGSRQSVVGVAGVGEGFPPV